jgi:hypothetical protein
MKTNAKPLPKFLLNQTRCLLQKSQRILIVASAFPSISEMIIARVSSETKNQELFM